MRRYRLVRWRWFWRFVPYRKNYYRGICIRNYETSCEENPSCNEDYEKVEMISCLEDKDDFQIKSVPTEGLLAHYEFNGDATDSVGLNHGTLVNDAHFSFDNLRGNVLRLEGNGYVDIPETFDLNGNDISLSVWFYLDDDSRHSSYNRQYALLGHKGKSWRRPFYLYLRTQSGREIAFGGTRYIRTGNIEPFIWTHVVATYDGSKFKVYKDGELIGTSLRRVGDMRALNDLTIGYMPTLNYPKYFIGMVDDVRIYNRALDEKEIKELFENS